MHSIISAYIREFPSEETKDLGKIYPIKLVLPPNKSRIMYFKSENLRHLVFKQLEEATNADK